MNQKNNVNILIIGPISKETGGIAQYINEQVKYLDEYNLSTHDIAPPEGSGPIWLFITLIGAILDALSYSFYKRPDIVHIHTSHRFSFLRSSFYVLFSKYIWRRPVVLHIHGSSFDNFVDVNLGLLAWFQEVVFSATCRVIVLSSYWKDVLSSRVSNSQIKVIPNAVEPTIFDIENKPSEHHIVFISNLIDRKGIHELVEAIRHIENTEQHEYRVTFAGKGPLSKKIKQLSEDFAHVNYRGYVSEVEKRGIIESGTIFVLPSHAEGLPIAILEGMAGGNAIISTNVGSIPEVVTEKNGITVEPKSTIDLENALKKLLADRKRTSEMGRQSRQLCEEKYSWNNVTERLQQVYEDCIKASRSA